MCPRAAWVIGGMARPGSEFTSGTCPQRGERHFELCKGTFDPKDSQTTVGGALEDLGRLELAEGAAPDRCARQIRKSPSSASGIA